MEDDEVEDEDVKGEEDDDVENDYVEEEEDDDVEDDDVEEEKDRSQDLGPHFARACAVEMHANMSQDPFHTEIYRKNAAAQIEPRTRTHTLCEPAGSNCTSRQHFTRATLYGMNGKMTCPGLSPERGHTLTNL